MQFRNSALILGCTLLLFGCGEGEGDDASGVQTNRLKLYAEGGIDANGDVTLKVTLTDVDDNSTPSSVKLEDGGVIYVEKNGTRTVMTAHQELFLYSTMNSDREYSHYYTATLRDETNAQVYKIIVDRNGYTDAFETVMTMPGRFEVTLPVQEISRATESLVVDWSPTEAQTGVRVETVSRDNICFVGPSVTLETDPGFAVLPPATLVDYGEPASCQGSVIVAKRVTGTVSPALNGGTVLAVRKASAVFVSNP